MDGWIGITGCLAHATPYTRWLNLSANVGVDASLILREGGHYGRWRLLWSRVGACLHHPRQDLFHRTGRLFSFNYWAFSGEYSNQMTMCESKCTPAGALLGSPMVAVGTHNYKNKVASDFPKHKDPGLFRIDRPRGAQHYRRVFLAGCVDSGGREVRKADT